MALTLPPTPPNRNSPFEYSDRADAFLGWWAAFVGEYNEDFGNRAGSAGIAAATGTPNTVQLDPGFFLHGAPDGCSFTFQVTTGNTAAVTMLLDGENYATATPQGAALPSGYLISGMTYLARMSNETWVIHRPIRKIENSNGVALQLEDGTQFCYHNKASTTGPNVASGALYNSGAAADDWTFPAAFTDTSYTIHGATNVAGRWLCFSSFSTTSIGINQWSAVSAGTNANLRLMAVGRWY